MTTEPNSTETAAAKWAETLARLEQAEAIYQEVRTASEPLYALEADFEARHRLVAPRPSKPGTPSYFEKREALFAAHPHYKAPAAIGDTLEALTEVVCEIESELMALPAPDLAALHWKLSRTMGAAWADDYIAQTLTDMDALLLAA